jgi:hypothetical protein
LNNLYLLMALTLYVLWGCSSNGRALIKACKRNGSVVQLDEPTDGVHPPHPDDLGDKGKEEQEKDEDNMDADKKQQKHNRGESQVPRNQGSTSNKTRALAASLLAEKVHEIAHVFMKKRDKFAPSASKLSPIADENFAT